MKESLPLNRQSLLAKGAGELKLLPIKYAIIQAITKKKGCI